MLNFIYYLLSADSILSRTITGGADAIYRLINSGAVEDLVNDIAHDESTQYYHEDPAVDSELRSLKAYELPRRPPLLSTPNIPPQKLVCEINNLYSCSICNYFLVL